MPGPRIDLSPAITSVRVLLENMIYVLEALRWIFKRMRKEWGVLRGLEATPAPKAVGIPESQE